MKRGGPPHEKNDFSPLCPRPQLSWADGQLPGLSREGPLTDLVLVRHGVNWPIANSGMCWEAFTRAAQKRRDSGHRYMAAY